MWKKIKIGAEVGIEGLIKAAFEYTEEHCINSKMGGDYSALTGGDWSVVYGGKNAKVRGGSCSVLAIQYWEGCKFKGIKFAEVDGKKIKADIYYKLDENGNFVEVE